MINSIFLIAYILYAYEFTNINFIEDPTITWTLFPATNATFTYCPSNINIVGGYKTFYESQYLTKNYSNLPSHSSIKVTFTLYLLDNWNGDSIEVFFDATSISNVSYTTSSAGNTNICGNSSIDMIKNITLTRNHSASLFNIKIQSHINLRFDYGLTLSWGIRNLQIFLDVPCPGLCISCSLSPKCDNLVLFAMQDPITYLISCKDGFFNDKNENRCNICHYSCKTCKGSGPYNCTTCFDDNFWDSIIFSCNHTSSDIFFFLALF